MKGLKQISSNDAKTIHQLSLWSLFLPVAGVAIVLLFILLMKTILRTSSVAIFFIIILFLFFVSLCVSIILGTISIFKMNKNNSYKGIWVSVLGISMSALFIILEIFLILLLTITS